MRSGIELYRHAFEQEIVANHAMLKMLASVPDEKRNDPLFQRALNIAYHMAACRQGFHDLLNGDAEELSETFESAASFDVLEGRFDEMEAGWKSYLASQDDVEGFFVFADGGEKWKLNREAQLFQLIGHAAYHRGQVVLLIDLLGGETFDTDYIGWFTENYPDGWCSA